MNGSVFETVEVFDGHTFAFDGHLELLVTAARTLGVTEPDTDRINSAVDVVVGRWGTEPGRLRISWSTGGRLHLVIAPLAIRRGPAVVEVADFPVDAKSPLCGVKSSGAAPVVATLASHPGADEVLLVDDSGDVTEGCSSNVFVVSGDELVTPPLGSGCRAGVTRSIVLKAASERRIPVREESIRAADLAGIQEAFLTSTGRHVQPIGSIDGRALTGPGLLTEAVRRGFAQIRSDSTR